MDELEKGTEYVLTSDSTGGVMRVTVVDFEYGGHVAVLRPTDPVMRSWYRHDYRLGRTQWRRLAELRDALPYPAR
jgi:hypothetical protein